MRQLTILFLLFAVTTLPAQFTLHLEQGIGISDAAYYQPIGLGVDYQVTKSKGFNLSIGLAYNQTTLEEVVSLHPAFGSCTIGECFTPLTSFVKSYESRQQYARRD